MSQDFRRKIMTREEVAQIIGARPRQRPVVMCHGVFDIVHPGHLRHLMYAKEKAAVLIASITGDDFITKANYRPYVPQELRALNLAALEVVDYVIIDPNPTAVANIKYLQPDFFAKGYEYFSNGIPERTRDEMTTLESYGGEMIFTPGDVVFSSSQLIETGLPNIAVEKLMTLMQSEGITFSDLRTALEQFQGVRVHVVGDAIVDSYIFCSLLGASTKSPVLDVRYEQGHDYVGGAAVVAKHMRAAGADVTLSTVLGEDEAKEYVLKDLAATGVQTLPVIDKMRPTTRKERIYGAGRDLVHVHRLDNRPVSDKAVEAIREALRTREAEIIIFSDFRHGIFSRQTIPALTESIPADALKVADSQVSSRWGNVLEFTDFDLLTPNEREARFALGDQDSVIRPLALKLFQAARCRFLIVKLRERGLLGYRSPGPAPREFFTVDSLVDHVADPTGAGDALLAYAALSQRVTDNIVIAAILGSAAAAVSCENAGNAPVTLPQVREKLDALERRAHYQ